MRQIVAYAEVFWNLSNSKKKSVEKKKFKIQDNDKPNVKAAQNDQNSLGKRFCLDRLCCVIKFRPQSRELIFDQNPGDQNKMRAHLISCLTQQQFSNFSFNINTNWKKKEADNPERKYILRL